MFRTFNTLNIPDSDKKIFGKFERFYQWANGEISAERFQTIQLRI
jgi:hypothetical protein